MKNLEIHFHRVKMLMELYGKKRIQKKLPNVLSFQQLLHIYSKGTACVNRYIVPKLQIYFQN